MASGRGFDQQAERFRRLREAPVEGRQDRIRALANCNVDRVRRPQVQVQATDEPASRKHIL
jgi:hypothetical protein